MRLLERAIASVERRLVLLAPPGTAVPDHFDRVDFDLDRHSGLLRAVQQFRGTVYLNDGAITGEQLSADGSHETPEDARSWHLLMVNARDQIVASAWYLDHHNHVHFERLRVRHSPLAKAADWRERLWHAVNGEISTARAYGLRYAEVGGWAVASEHRRTCDGLVVALASYCLGRICGDTLGIATATVKHGSSSILCRIGGRPLHVEGVTLPPYYDERYRCMMEVLRFDSRTPAPRFEALIEDLRNKLTGVSVVARPYWPMTHRSRIGLRAASVIEAERGCAPSLDYETVTTARQP